MSDIRVFISFAETDRIASERVAACLRDAGADVWCAAPESADTAPDDATRDAELRSRPLYIVLLSEAAYESPPIERECRLAVALAQEQPHRRVVPLVVHPTHYVGTWEFLDGIPRLHLDEIPAPLLAERILTPPDASQDAPPPDLPLDDDTADWLEVARRYRGLARAEARNIIPSPERGSEARLTREMASALKRAGVKAQDRRYPRAEPLHLLFGILSCPTAGALEVIAACGEQPPQIFAQLHKMLPWGDRPLAVVPPLTPESKRVIELAVAEARALEQLYVGTIQMLLGILAEEGTAARLLKDHGITREDARAAAARLLRGSPSG